MPQLSQTDAVTLHYFQIKGAGGTATIVMEQGGVDYKAKGYSFPEWMEFKPKTPTGLLPVIEYADGTMVPESGAIARVAAAQAGLLGEGRDFARSEMLLGMIADTWKLVGGNAPTMMTAGEGGSWTAEKTAAWQNEWKPKVKESLARFPKLLAKEGDRFTSKGDLLGEVDLWYRMYQLKMGPYAEVLDDVPGMKPFFDRVSELQGPKKFHENQTKFGELPHYFVACP